MTPHPRGLLDTSVLIDFDGGVISRYADSVAISVLSLAELADGLHTGDAVRDADRKERYQRIASTFDVVLFDESCARAYGALAALVRHAGRSPRPRRFDLLIAATAVRQELPLLTRNPNDLAGLHEALTVVAV